MKGFTNIYPLFHRLYCKTKPLSVTYGIGKFLNNTTFTYHLPLFASGIEEHDKEGRVITAEFDKYYFVTSYVPNSGEKLKR